MIRVSAGVLCALAGFAVSAWGASIGGYDTLLHDSPGAVATPVAVAAFPVPGDDALAFLLESPPGPASTSLAVNLFGAASGDISVLGDSEPQSRVTTVVLLALLLGGVVKTMVSRRFYDLLAAETSTLWAIDHEASR